MGAKKVEGTKKADVIIYALSTCGWCRKTKTMLSDLGVEYSYIDVDLETGQEREECLAAIKEHNPALSFPTVVVDHTKCIIGFKEKELKEALGI